MSKQWFYEVMGSPVGPISSADLRICVTQRRILPETRIRLGVDGKWQTADKVKGLFDPPAVEAKAAPATAVSKTATPKSIPIAETATAEIATVQTATMNTMPLRSADAEATERTYHYAGEDHAPPKVTDDAGAEEYDFFKFVGFELAIGPGLHKVLCEHCRVNRLTISQAIKRALAEHLNRKDLLGEGPPPSPAPAEPVGIS